MTIMTKTDKVTKTTIEKTGQLTEIEIKQGSEDQNIFKYTEVETFWQGESFYELKEKGNFSCTPDSCKSAWY